MKEDFQNPSCEAFRIESDHLGELQVPVNAYYGVQTQRGINNYKVSNLKMSDFPEYIIAMGYIKLAAVEANHELGVINDEIIRIKYPIIRS